MGKNLGGAIIGLLASERVELRAAAVTVLVAVGKDDPAIVAALVRRLGDPDDGVRQIALDGLAALGTTAAAETVLRNEIGSGSVGARRAVAQLLLRRGTQPAVEAVIDQLGDVEFGEAALQLLRQEIEQRREKVVTTIEKLAVARATKAAKKPAKKAAAEPPPLDPMLANLLRLLGDLARPSARALLQKFTGDAQPPPLRLAAQAALDAIAGASGATKALVEALGGDDPTARDAAARGLAKAPEAVLPLVRALLTATDEQRARRYAAAIRAHRGHIAQAAADELTAALRAPPAPALERILGELVADVAPAAHVELAFDRARRLRKAGKPVEAFGSLKPLLRTRADLDAAMDDEQRFLLALLALEAAGEGILRTARTDDPVFDHFARLAAKGFPVAVRLNREPELSDETIYALGFRLLESGAGANEDLGAELLQGIIDERPRSKLAKAAKNKLKLTGHLDGD